MGGAAPICSSDLTNWIVRMLPALRGCKPATKIFVAVDAGDSNRTTWTGSDKKRLSLNNDGHWIITLSEQGYRGKLARLRSVEIDCQTPLDVRTWEMEVQARNVSTQKPAVWAIVSDVFLVERAPLCSECQNLATGDGYSHCADHIRVPRQLGNAFESNDVMHVNSQCPKYLRALEFLEMLGLNNFLDRYWDMCYCENCYGKDLPDYVRDKSCYSEAFPDFIENDNGGLVPRGWQGFGLVVPDRYRKQEVFNWPTSFHGTRPELVADILCHGHIGVPGDVLNDGSILTGLNSDGRSDKVIYTSPTAAYAGLQLYAAVCQFSGSHCGQVVLQCRQEAQSVKKKQGETMGYKKKETPEHHVCKHTSLYNSNIEWLSEHPEKCVPYRVLIRVFPVDNLPADNTLRSPADLSPGPRPGPKDRGKEDGPMCIWV